MRWVPDIRGRWRWRCRPGAAALVVGQLTQKSTIVALLNAIALLIGWHATPDRIDAVGTVLALIDTVVLAVIQEGPPPPPPPAEGCPP